MTLKVNQGHWRWHNLISHISLSISALLKLCVYFVSFLRYSKSNNGVTFQFMHDRYIAEIYRPGSMFLSLIVLVYIYLYYLLLHRYLLTTLCGIRWSFKVNNNNNNNNNKNECHSNIIVDKLQGCSHSKKLRESESESRSSKVVWDAHSAAEFVLPSSACAAIYGVMPHVHINNTPIAAQTSSSNSTDYCKQARCR